MGERRYYFVFVVNKVMTRSTVKVDAFTLPIFANATITRVVVVPMQSVISTFPAHHCSKISKQEEPDRSTYRGAREISGLVVVRDKSPK